MLGKCATVTEERRDGTTEPCPCVKCRWRSACCSRAGLAMLPVSALQRESGASDRRVGRLLLPRSDSPGRLWRVGTELQHNALNCVADAGPRARRVATMKLGG